MAGSISRRRGHGRVAIILAWSLAGLFVLVVAASGGAWLYYGHRVTPQLRALRAAGEPLSLAELHLPDVPASQDAASEYAQLLGPPGELGFTRGRGLLGELPKRYDCLLQTRPSADLATVRQALRDPGVQRVVGLVRAATAKPRYLRPLPLVSGSLAPSSQLPAFRRMAGLLCTLAVSAAAEGDMAAAGDWLVRCTRLARHVQEEPTTMGWLGAMAVEALAREAARSVLALGSLPERQYVALRQELLRGPPDEALRAAIAVERAEQLGEYARCERNPLYGMGLLSACVDSPSALAGLLPPYWKRQELLLLGGAEFALAASREPLRYWSVLSPASPPPLRWSGGPAGFETGVWKAQVTALVQRQAAVGLTAVALELNHWHARHGGYPTALSQLGPALPRDPYSGGAFRYRPTPSGYLLYSLGPDLRDQGGRRAHRDALVPGADFVW